MKPKTVAKRAAELGLDQEELVQALKYLSVRKLKHYGYFRRYRHGWRSRRSRPLLSIEKAADALGVDAADAQTQIQHSYPRNWTPKEILDALFAFHKEHGRWPVTRELRLKNGLPSYQQWRWHAGQGSGWRVSPRDHWERLIAKDRRCTPEMAFQLRNVLARKEAIDRIGFDTLVKKKYATLIATDPEYGTLYQLPGEMPKEPMVLLKVINSTAEPDGSFADYYLRVPPKIKNVREAVRWTFGGDEVFGSQMYEPLAQT